MLLLSLEVPTWAMREVAKAAKKAGVDVALKTSPLDATNCDEIIKFLEEGDIKMIFTTGLEVTHLLPKRRPMITVRDAEHSAAALLRRGRRAAHGR